MKGIGNITITKLLVVVTISSFLILTGLVATIVLIMVVQSLTPIQIVQYLTEVLSGRILARSAQISSWLMLVAGLLTLVVTVCKSASALIRRYKVGLIRVTTDARNSQADPSPTTSDEPRRSVGKIENHLDVKSIIVGICWGFYVGLAVVFGTLAFKYYSHDWIIPKLF